MLAVCAMLAFSACGGQSKEAAFLKALKSDPTISSIDFAAVSDTRLIAAGKEVCEGLRNVESPTIATLTPIVEQELPPKLTGAHNIGANGADNGPVVLAYGIAGAAIPKFCPDKTSALDQ